jgi:glycosyltransferase involved in cell wall biosynthesis
MRVAVHAGQLLQPVPGGIGRYVHALLDHLPDADVDVTAFAAGARPADVAPKAPWIDLGWPHGSVRYELWHRTGRPRVRMDTEVVLATSLAVPPVRDVPLAVTVHDVAFLRVPESTTKRGIAFHAKGLKVARRRAAMVIAPSDFTRAELVAEGFAPEQIEVVRFGVDPPPPRADAHSDAVVARVGVRHPYVLTVGTVEPRKDLPTLVRAVEHARRTHPDLTLVIVGPAGWGDVGDIDRPFVQRLGRQPWDTVDALYRRADAFCCASLYEGFGLPALEAMARGAPTISTTGSSMQEFVRDAGLLFAPRDVNACAAAIERILGDDALRVELATAGTARAAELTWERTVAGHTRLFEQLVAQTRP